jgi:hypothetical protein
MKRLGILVVAVLVACGDAPLVTDDAGAPADAAALPEASRDASSPDAAAADATSDAPKLDAAASPKTIIVIPMENKASSVIYGNVTDAPYINGLLAQGAHATKFADELPKLDSEPHYVWMEAGTNVFSDASFVNDDPPSATHSTSSTLHLVTQLEAAGISWMSYQEDIKAGTCPIASTGFYAPKHDPFVFFQDVVGSPPSAANARCVAHHKPYSALAADLAGPLARYVFVTPNLCHDMHGDAKCPQGTGDAANIKAGDAWLKTELPPILAWAKAHDGVIFITWDEGDSSNLIPFLALGKGVKVGATSTVAYSHSSLLASIEKMLGVPLLATVKSANDFADLFEAGQFP